LKNALRKYCELEYDVEEKLDRTDMCEWRLSDGNYCPRGALLPKLKCGGCHEVVDGK
jgi:hypothetical protein